jgi:hypothetical protein
VRKELAELEATRLAKGGVALHKTSPAAFLSLGLELEESQCVVSFCIFVHTYAGILGIASNDW